MKSLIVVLTMITTAAHAVPERKDSFICSYKDPSTMIKEPVKNDYAEYFDNSKMDTVMKQRAVSVKAADGKTNN